ncbi:hypothetical protein VNO80_20444 [Phaseolus coccineus]|uniref:Uncharacterized protein n=1 Tax=Phaseolus coccineus TaxID=3886 RepID=A0AAN9MMK1_PHACN
MISSLLVILYHFTMSHRLRNWKIASTKVVTAKCDSFSSYDLLDAPLTPNVLRFAGFICFPYKPGHRSSFLEYDYCRF